jgi:hypothetical protein
MSTVRRDETKVSEIGSPQSPLSLVLSQTGRILLVGHEIYTSGGISSIVTGWAELSLKCYNFCGFN